MSGQHRSERQFCLPESKSDCRGTIEEQMANVPAASYDGSLIIIYEFKLRGSATSLKKQLWTNLTLPGLKALYVAPKIAAFRSIDIHRYAPLSLLPVGSLFRIRIMSARDGTVLTTGTSASRLASWSERVELAAVESNMAPD
ncbi:hypothetical protein M378DRAFT_170072 [Amanita muscaria Koide BX008]|uniref:Uncharacterized protein n=1 Tax=Amanita muscaria (strain Koide BX008) TaxID=946122 RepID=A0A0C2WC57_AMAMK|nr:hypothetical protein M378DRAFT_170072 [Amanita muscaria Koide BX008]